MMRVLTLSSLFPDAIRPNFGGFVERQTIGLAAQEGIELRVVAPIGLPPWPVSLLPRYRALTTLPRQERWRGLTVYRPRFVNLPGTSGRFHAAMLRRAVLPLLRRIAREFAFDVIDASFFFPDGPAAVALGEAFGVPVSIKARGADIHYWGTARATARQVIAAGRAAAGMLAVSAAMQRDMVAIGLPAERIRVHRTGVDLERFAPVDRGVAKVALGVGGPLVAAVGALIPRKGHEVVIRAIAALPGVELRIAGEGPSRAALQALIAELGVADRVHLLGSVAHGALPELIAAADVMALASSSEGLANAWVEALACGTPIVITDAGGARELVTDPAMGRVVARTPQAFAAAIGELLTAPPVRQAVRAGALGYTWDANGVALAAHLRGLVARGGSVERV